MLTRHGFFIAAILKGFIATGNCEAFLSSFHGRVDTLQQTSAQSGFQARCRVSPARNAWRCPDLAAKSPQVDKPLDVTKICAKPSQESIMAV
ncbi:hypothetical protein P3G55_25130, partial [Leptospira sp. 96542]|nr:hypothetical protein [Leptospira sp. 96542]